MSAHRIHQKAARDVQAVVGCAYSVALSYAQREDVQAVAQADTRNLPFRAKLADAVFQRLTREGR